MSWDTDKERRQRNDGCKQQLEQLLLPNGLRRRRKPRLRPRRMERPPHFYVWTKSSISRAVGEDPCKIPGSTWMRDTNVIAGDTLAHRNIDPPRQQRLQYAEREVFLCWHC